MGIWPPSKAGEMFFRAFVPLVPRPAVLPFEPSPRPTRVLSFLEPAAGRRWWTLSTCSRFSVCAALAAGFSALAAVVSEAAAAFDDEAFAVAFFSAAGFSVDAALAEAFA